MKHQARIKRIFSQGLIAATLLAAGMANAADPAVSLNGSAFATIGSDGLNLGYGKRFNALWGGRVMLNSGIAPHNDNAEISDNHYDAKFKKSAGVNILADLYPIEGSGFRVSGGLSIANYKNELANGSAGSYSFNGHTYSAAQVGQLSGEQKYKSVAPYIGIGWESRSSESGWRFVSDLGVAYLGKSSSSLSASRGATNSILQQDVAAEAKQLNESTALIIFNVGASYAF